MILNGVSSRNGACCRSGSHPAEQRMFHRINISSDLKHGRYYAPYSAVLGVQDVIGLDVTFDLDDLLGCLMYDFWTCELAVSNFSLANKGSTLPTIQCLKRCCLDASIIVVVVQKLHQW
ncbi:hypothetical protein Tco_1383976 [Tanacetum coccineum]